MRFPPTITSRTNAHVKMLRAAFGGEAAQPGDPLAIEGENLIGEALRSGLRFDSVYLREGSEGVLDRYALQGLQPESLFILSRDVFSSAVATASPQGIAAIAAIPDIAAADLGPGSVVLVLEAVQDPGNIGTLLRSAEAFGVKQVFTTQDTVNRWNPKAVRASAGSVFRVPVVRAPLAAIRTHLHSLGFRFFAAVAEALGATSTLDANLGQACALMLGNEGAGLSAAALRLADERIHIPCHVESLNVAIAGSTLMYEAMRQQIAGVLPSAEGTA